MSRAMTQSEFEALVARLGAAATKGDGEAFAACFTEDGVYHDYIYGPHKGRDSIADMLENLFHRDAADYDWRFFDPITNGRIGFQGKEQSHSLLERQKPSGNSVERFSNFLVVG